MSKATRGRPRKFGRPARVVALTLPDDVVQWLRSINPDLGWAVVSLFERGGQRASRSPQLARWPLAELVQLPGGRSLIIVDPEPFKGFAHVSTIPLAGGRAFLALTAGHGMADLELAIRDRLDTEELTARRREALEWLKNQLRAWRLTPGLNFQTRSIIVAMRAGRAAPAGGAAKPGAGRGSSAARRA